MRCPGGCWAAWSTPLSRTANRSSWVSTTASSGDGAPRSRSAASTVTRCAPPKATSHKASGLRWLSFALLPEIRWAGRCWALPFLAMLAPSQRYWETHRPGQRPFKTLADWARQGLLQPARWLPHRRIVAVADTSFAAIELLAAVRHRVTVVTRLRLDAALRDPPPPRPPGQRGRSRLVGDRQPTLQQRLHNPRTRWRRLRVSGWD